MDQSASVLSQPGSALYVGFSPELTATPIAFPTGTTEFAFLIAQTFVTADKHTTGPINYNLRVVECTLAAHVLSRLVKVEGELKKDRSPLGSCLRGVQDAYFAQLDGSTDNPATSIDDEIRQLNMMAQIVDDYLIQEEGYTRQDLSFLLKKSEADIEPRFLRQFPVRTDVFKLRQRAMHVFSEARRVKEFYQLLSQASQPGDGQLRDEPLLVKLGEIMNAGQDSCRDLYQNSCPELDMLCRIARENGSYGSRLTGAGFGGSTVHLVPRSKVEAIKTAWKNEYYSKRWPEVGDRDLEDWRGAVVVSEPEAGASILKIESDLGCLSL